MSTVLSEHKLRVSSCFTPHVKMTSKTTPEKQKKKQQPREYKSATLKKKRKTMTGGK